MADNQESEAVADTNMTTKKEKQNSNPAPSTSKDMENTRKSTRLKHHARYEKHMSMFVMHPRRAERRARSSESSSGEYEPSDKIPKKAEKPVKPKAPKSPARPKEKSPVKKQIKVEVATSSEEDDEPERQDPNDKDFNLSMLNLRRVGDEAPRPDKKTVALNARGMPQRVRKKNKLFYDDNVVNAPVVKTKYRRLPNTEKRNFVRGKQKSERNYQVEEVVKPVQTVEDSKEANSMRQRIGLKLRNLLKLPKAQRWVFNEWFYSNIDHVLFLGTNDFLLCLKETFGHLKTTLLTRTQWCVIRRLMGKPRRCSQNFFREERSTLERRRNLIRMVQQRKTWDVAQFKDLPDRIPLQLSVNSRVTAKLRKPQAGLFTGKVDAVDPSNHNYRITFDRVGLGTHSIPDYEVLLDGEPDMVSMSVLHKRYLTSKLNQQTPKPRPQTWVERDMSTWSDNIVSAKFPKQFYEMMVRICKILKEKRLKVQTLKDMNTEAEKMVTHSQDYPEEFQRRYAAVIIDLESINISLKRFLTAVQKYCHELAPDACSNAMLTPSFIRDKSLTEAKGMVDKFFKDKSPLKNTNMVSLVTELVALVIQVQHLTRLKASAQERQVLKQSIAKIKTMISPKNLLVFQNKVEVHIQYIETTLGQGSHLAPLLMGATPSKQKD